MKKLFIFLLIITFSQGLFAQLPDFDGDEPLVIKNVHIHVGNGEFLEDHDIVINSQGKIERIQPDIQMADDVYVWDAEGKHLYPGFIALNSKLGLVEIEAVRATRDFREIGKFNPHIRSIIAYNTDSKIIPTVRSNGVLLAQIVPEGQLITGSSSVVKLEAWNWEDALIKEDEGIHIDWPTDRSVFGGENAKTNKENYNKEVDEIVSFLKKSKAYYHQDDNDDDLVLNAMKRLFDKTKTLYIHSDQYSTILEAMHHLKSLDVNVAVVGGYYAPNASDLLKVEGVTVIVSSTQALPNRQDDDYDYNYTLPDRLEKQGLDVVISHPGSWEQRNLPFQAGQAVAFGMDYEEAVKSITGDAAKVLGIEENYGTIEVGKSATLIVSDGDALDMRTSKIRVALIDGKNVNLSNKHKELYEKFSAKYGHKVEDN